MEDQRRGASSGGWGLRGKVDNRWRGGKMRGGV